MEIWNHEIGSSTRRDEIMPGHYGGSSSSSSSSSSSGGGWSPGVQHSGMPTRQTTTTTGGGWSPGVGGQQHIPRTKTITPKDTRPSHLGLGRYIKPRTKPDSYLEQFNRFINTKLNPLFFSKNVLGPTGPKGLYSPVNLTQHGTRLQNLASIYSKGFRPSKVPTWAGTGKTFTSNLGVAGRYGKQIPVVSSKFNLTSPFGGGFNKSGISLGKEVVQSPSQATKGMNLATKLGTQYTGPTAQRIMNAPGITSMAGPVLSRLAAGVNVASFPLAYTQAAAALQNRLASQGLTGEGGIADVSGGWGAEAAGADVEYDIDQTGAYNPLPYYLGGLAHLLYGGRV